MAIAHRETEAFDSGFNSFAASVPATAVAGDMMLLLIGGKPYNAGLSVSGWTQIGSFYTDGTTAPSGNDTGSTFVTAFYKEHSGSESNPEVTEGTPAWNVVAAVIMAFSKGASEAWATPVIRGGGDSSSGTGFSVTCESDPGVTAGDHCISFAAFQTDAATPCSTHIVATQAGVTFSNTHDPATDFETTTGADLAMCINRASVTSGTGSAAPVIAATLASAGTGSAAFIRLRVSAVIASGTGWETAGWW